MQRVNITFSDELYRTLKQTAQIKSLSLSHLIRQYVENALHLDNNHYNHTLKITPELQSYLMLAAIESKYFSKALFQLVTKTDPDGMKKHEATCREKHDTLLRSHSETI